MWDLIVSVPDHCLSVYFSLLLLYSICHMYYSKFDRDHVFDVISALLCVFKNSGTRVFCNY